MKSISKLRCHSCIRQYKTVTKTSKLNSIYNSSINPITQQHKSSTCISNSRLALPPEQQYRFYNTIELYHHNNVIIPSNFKHEFYDENYIFQTINVNDSKTLQQSIPLLNDMNKVRGRDFTNIDITIAKRKNNNDDNNSNQRYPADSYVSLRYNFKEHSRLQQRYNLFNSNKMRIGRILEDADALSGDICYKHIGVNYDQHVTVVTATIDRVDLFNNVNNNNNVLAADSLECDWVMSGHITWIGSSSMEVRIDIGRIIDENNNNIELLGTAFFVFVARQKDTYKKYDVPKLVCISDSDILLFEQGIRHQYKRRKRIEQPHQLKLPSNDEVIHLHNLYIDTQQYTSNIYKEWSIRNMSDTMLSKTVLMHSQDRNIHNKMFGGHLLRLAFELSWACVYVNTHIMPRLQYVDDIHFYLPVDIGSLLTFNSYIWYTDTVNNTVFVYVQANVIDTRTGQTKHTTNEFYFQYLCQPNQDQQSIPYIVPQTYQQQLQYLEGRRRTQDFIVHQQSKHQSQTAN